MLLRLMALAKEAERRARFFGHAWVERWRVCVPCQRLHVAPFSTAHYPRISELKTQKYYECARMGSMHSANTASFDDASDITRRPYIPAQCSSRHVDGIPPNFGSPSRHIQRSSS